MTLVALGLAEAGLRVRAWIRYGTTNSTLRDPMLTWDENAGLFVPKPGYEIQGTRYQVKINSLGFRGDEFAAAKPPRTFRIAVLGASTSFSAEVPNHATWPHRLQELLQSQYPAIRIEVVNAAVGGYIAADNVRNLRHRVVPLSPDLVIYYEANNEVVHDTQQLAETRGLIRPGENKQGPVGQTLSKVSLLFDLVYKNLAIARGGKDSAGRIDAVPPELPQHFIGEIDEMRVMLRERDVPLLLSTFIVKYRHDQDRAMQVANADVAFYYMPWMTMEGMLSAMDVYNQAILDYAGAHDVPVVDERNVIPADGNHFVDCMHLSVAGNEAMAQRFNRFIQANAARLGLGSARPEASSSSR
ncbi:MAG TPA: SGNH/GDSL hydrolase family protein [Vicinamibacterales bacterium]|nr:SGNH/GDSL hydrolase family protein [Vicinamibacterales bacterium]